MSTLQNSVNANATTPLKTIEGGSGVSSPTAHGVLVAEGSSAFNPIVLGAGQVLIGTTAGDPAAATLTQGSGITITSASGSITIAASGGSGGTNTIVQITQSAHGFSQGNILAYNGSAYVLAKADTAANAEVVGAVDTVVNSNVFNLIMEGYSSNWSGLTAGNVYFLSDSSAGAYTTTPPSAVGHIVKPLFTAVSTTAIVFNNMRGDIITAAGSTISPAWNLITTVTLSSTASPVTLTSSSITNYNRLKISLNAMVPSALAHFNFGASTNGGSSYAINGIAYAMNGASSVSSAYNTGTPVQLSLGAGVTASTATSGWIIIENSTDGTGIIPYRYYFDQGSGSSTFAGQGYFQTSYQLNALELTLTSGNFTSGTIYLSGM